VITVYILSSIGFNFQLRVDFGFNVLFPHIFTVMHHNSMKQAVSHLRCIGAHSRKRNPCNLAQIPVCPCSPLVLAQERICALKQYFKTLKLNLECFFKGIIFVDMDGFRMIAAISPSCCIALHFAICAPRPSQCDSVITMIVRD
jgi:hypothetical protein